ncbi:MAG: hypothetical protein LBU42_06550, partial [Prevotellaceae bacterium]|nr:hypothetical protein [Prevotellaceae bacterium]
CFQTQTNLIKQPPAAIFCSLPFIAEVFNKRFLQFVPLTFMVISFLVPLKNQKWKWVLYLLYIEVVENPHSE